MFKAENIFNSIFLYITFYGLLVIIVLGYFSTIFTSDEEKFYRSWEDESIIVQINGILIWIYLINILLQVLVYTFFFPINLFRFFKEKKNYQRSKIVSFLFAAMSFLIWIFLTMTLLSNGKYEWYWGPNDSGGYFMILVSLTINYIYFKSLKMEKFIKSGIGNIT